MVPLQDTESGNSKHNTQRCEKGSTVDFTFEAKFGWCLSSRSIGGNHKINQEENQPAGKGNDSGKPLADTAA